MCDGVGFDIIRVFYFGKYAMSNWVRSRQSFLCGYHVTYASGVLAQVTVTQPEAPYALIRRRHFCPNQLRQSVLR